MEQGRITKILAATDFSDVARFALRRAVLLAGRSRDIELTFVHGIEQNLLQQLGLIGHAEAPGAALDDLARELAPAGARSIATLVLEGAIAKALPEAAREYDLLVLGARGSHRIRAYAFGTTARRILYRAITPALVVRRDAEAPYRKVLIATDFSRPSLRAARLAVDLAPAADFTVVHAYQAPFEMSMNYADVSEDVIQDYRARAQAAGEVEMLRFVQEAGLPTHRTTRRLEPGYPARVLGTLAADAGTDLLVLGKQGTSRIGDALFGSVTEHLLVEAECDVLVTR